MLNLVFMDLDTVQSYVLILVLLLVVAIMLNYFWRAYRGRLVADIKLAVHVPGSQTEQISLVAPMHRGSLRCYLTNPAGWYRGSISLLDSKGKILSLAELPGLDQYSFLGRGTINRAIVQSPGVLLITFKTTAPIQGYVEFRIDLDWNVTDVQLRETLKPRVPEKVRVCLRGM